jgi:hypothetical protein
MSSKIEGCSCPPKGYDGAWAAGPCPVHQGLRRLAAPVVERQPSELTGLSSEAYSVLIGMVEHCLNVRACMGMDEGFKDFDTEEEHDFVKELHAFVAAPPELAELQATIDRMAVEIDRLNARLETARETK